MPQHGTLKLSDDRSGVDRGGVERMERGGMERALHLEQGPDRTLNAKDADHLEQVLGGRSACRSRMM